MVVQDFSSKVVFLDTAPLIYFIEGQSIHQSLLVKIFDLNDKGSFLFVTSAITLLEVLVKPLRDGQSALAAQYRNILTTATEIELFDVTPVIANTAAILRAKYNLRTPDSIQLATAIDTGADYFLTNDSKLKIVAEVNVVTLSEVQ